MQLSNDKARLLKILENQPFPIGLSDKMDFSGTESIGCNLSGESMRSVLDRFSASPVRH